jgi:hypothetical protein
MVPDFTPQVWATLNDLAQRLAGSSEASRSKEKRELRAAMRSLGFEVSRFGIRNVTPDALAKLLAEGRVRVRA